jgi:hypothetical protein
VNFIPPVQKKKTNHLHHRVALRIGTHGGLL